MANNQYGLGRRLDPETPRAAALYPVRAATTDRTVRNWNQKGAWLDQGRTGTCVGNAFAHRRADGPVKVSGIDQAFARQLYLEASALYWGEPDTSLQKGTSAVSACQVLMRRGAIDQYEWVANWNAGPENLRYTLLELGPVCVGSNWYESMYSPVRVGDQFYMKVNYSSQLHGGHEYVINKLDLDPQDGSEPYYRIKNSWGQGWAKNGTARFRLADLEELIFEGWGDAVLIHEVPGEAA
jgi:hypothetical protein